jgi:hypothetical protein
MGSGRNCVRVGNASERVGDDTKREQRPSKLEEAKGRAPGITKRYALQLGTVTVTPTQSLGLHRTRRGLT